MPRPYQLGERAAQIQATRQRIIEAAIELYVEVGISAATLREIGARADVAPGTLRNHFRSRDDLDRAIIDHLTASITLPDRSIFDGARTIEERLGRLIRAGAVFIDEARRMYTMWLREPMLTGSWAAKGAEFGALWDDLFRAALGPLADDGEAMAILRAVIQPSFLDALRSGSRSAEQAAALATAAVSPWFATRERGQARER